MVDKKADRTDRYGTSERAQEYRRLMRLLAEDKPTLDWMMRDAAVNLYLDDPTLTPEEIIVGTPKDYAFYTLHEASRQEASGSTTGPTSE
jgi:hypothetical protein